MIAEPIEKTDYMALINEYGTLPYLGNVGKGYAIQQRPEELSAFVEFCVQHNVQTVLELGGADGGLSCFMAEALGWKVTSVDIVPPKRRHENVEFIQMTTDAAYFYLQGRAFDLVFIDADHSYESVKSDHLRYKHLGKIVAFHDINEGRDCCEGVTRYWREWRDGVKALSGYFHEAIATGGKDAPGIGWYINHHPDPGKTRWELYSEPLPDATPDICVVSGTCDRLPYLRKMIDSARTSVPRGIALTFCIVDGGSTDGTLDYLRQQPDVTLIEHGEKRGIAAAYRDGFDAAQGKYVVTANDDIEFVGLCLWNALNHLETHPNAGGVAFYFDEPNKAPGKFMVNEQGMQKDGKTAYVPYAQVGMFRKWVGDAAGWWGGHDPKFPAKNYGLDNYLTSRVLEMGYTIDAVKDCQFHDFLVNDALRAANQFDALHSNQHPDSALWRNRFNGGFPVWNSTPVPPQATQHLRILYMPILAGRTAFERDQMRGLYDSLCKVGIVTLYDYWGANQARRDVGSELVALVKAFKPHIFMSQIQDTGIITPQIYYKIRAAHPAMVCTNWNGDEMRAIWERQPMVEIMRAVDLHLTVNPALFPGALKHGVNMAVWLDAHQEAAPVEMSACDVVFLGTNYAPPHLKGAYPRKEMIDYIRQRLPEVQVDVYGYGWQDAIEENTYDYTRNHGAYAAAKIAIVDNMYQDAWGYISNRLYNSLAYAQCVLARRIDGAETLFNLPDDAIVWWDTYDELCELITYYLQHDKERRAIGQKARAFVRQYHTFDARVRELIDHDHGLIAALVKKK